MKFYALAILFYAFYAQALPTWFPVGKPGANTGYLDKTVCEAKEGQECFDMEGKDGDITEVSVVQVDDLSKPIYAAKSEIEVCAGFDDCFAKQSAKVCPDLKFINAEYTEVYCTSLTGYQKKDQKVLVENPTKKANKADKADKKDKIDKLADKGADDVEFGKRILTAIVGRIKQSNEAQAVKDATFGNLDLILKDLSYGKVLQSKTKIQAFTVDTVITQPIKNQILNEYDRNGY